MKIRKFEEGDEICTVRRPKDAWCASMVEMREREREILPAILLRPKLDSRENDKIVPRYFFSNGLLFFFVE